MGRILAIDYGRKRIGLAVTDSNKIIANRLDTISTHEIWNFLNEYLKKEAIEKVVVGYPKTLNNEASEAVKYINPFLKKFQQKYSGVSLELIDERFTSRIAMRTMVDAGLKKKKRQDKKLVDGVSATILLQNYLEYQRNT